MSLPSKPCPDCGVDDYWHVRLRPDTIHYAEVRCGVCGRFLKWMAKPLEATPAQELF
jgi:endogenous inhibitor of DNA gyrase (YacG/DUF329 family)